MYPENEVTSSEGFEPVMACRRFEKGGSDVGSEVGASIRRRRADGLAAASGILNPSGMVPYCCSLLVVSQ